MATATNTEALTTFPAVMSFTYIISFNPIFIHIF